MLSSGQAEGPAFITFYVTVSQEEDAAVSAVGFGQMYSL